MTSFSLHCHRIRTSANGDSPSQAGECKVPLHITTSNRIYLSPHSPPFPPSRKPGLTINNNSQPVSGPALLERRNAVIVICIAARARVTRVELARARSRKRGFADETVARFLCCDLLFGINRRNGSPETSPPASSSASSSSSSSSLPRVTRNARLEWGSGWGDVIIHAP